MRHARVQVKRDTNTVHSITVAPWEIPILEFLFDEGNVTHMEQFVDVPGREYPDPREEFVRLQKAYGADVQTNVPYAVSVYGTTRTGVRALTRAMDTAREEEEEDGQAPSATTGARRTGRRKLPAPATAPKKARRQYASDPLMA